VLLVPLRNSAMAGESSNTKAIVAVTVIWRMVNPSVYGTGQ
jgi:hypothetical protein